MSKCWAGRWLLGSGQSILEPHDHEIIDQVRANVLGTAAHVLLFEAAQALRNGTCNFTLGLQRDGGYTRAIANSGDRWRRQEEWGDTRGR